MDKLPSAALNRWLGVLGTPVCSWFEALDAFTSDGPFPGDGPGQSYGDTAGRQWPSLKATRARSPPAL